MSGISTTSSYSKPFQNIQPSGTKVGIPAFAARYLAAADTTGVGSVDTGRGSELKATDEHRFSSERSAYEARRRGLIFRSTDISRTDHSIDTGHKRVDTTSIAPLTKAADGLVGNNDGRMDLREGIDLISTLYDNGAGGMPANDGFLEGPELRMALADFAPLTGKVDYKGHHHESHRTEQYTRRGWRA